MGKLPLDKGTLANVKATSEKKEEDWKRCITAIIIFPT